VNFDQLIKRLQFNLQSAESAIELEECKSTEELGALEKYINEIKDTIRRLEIAKEVAQKYDLTIAFIDLVALEAIIRYKPQCLLILLNPLKDAFGNNVYDAAPSVLLDPNEDGFVKNHSIYQTSLVYDWEKDSGLIFISCHVHEAELESG
jgi:hypothetical protein